MRSLGHTDGVADTGATETRTSPGGPVVLLTLAAAQFLMTLDSSVMNVSIATVAKDVGTTVTGIQFAITLYTLVMAAFMITGGKVGQIIGRKRAFMIGCVIYGCGSAITAAATSLPVLIVGWSVLEGLGAALIMPAVVALVATNFGRSDRPRVYGLVASAGAVAVAVGPLLGGLCTTYLSWRWVFVGEVVLVLGILVLSRRIADSPPVPGVRLDPIGTLLSAAGLGHDRLWRHPLGNLGVRAAQARCAAVVRHVPRRMAPAGGWRRAPGASRCGRTGACDTTRPRSSTPACSRCAACRAA